MRLLLALAAAAGGLASEPTLPQLRIEVEGDGCRIHIRNLHTAALIGVALQQVDYPGSSWMQQQKLSLAPAAESSFWLKNQTVCASPDYIRVRAAVFADGSTAGDEKLADDLRWASPLQCVPRTLVFLRSGPQIARADELARQHITRLAELLRSGALLVAGPTDEKPLAGMAIYATADPAEAGKLARTDPFVAHGVLEIARVQRWRYCTAAQP